MPRFNIKVVYVKSKNELEKDTPGMNQGTQGCAKAGFIVFLLYPYYRNFGKRMIKALRISVENE